MRFYDFTRARSLLLFIFPAAKMRRVRGGEMADDVVHHLFKSSSAALRGI